MLSFRRHILSCGSFSYLDRYRGASMNLDELLVSCGLPHHRARKRSSDIENNNTKVVRLSHDHCNNSIISVAKLKFEGTISLKKEKNYEKLERLIRTDSYYYLKQ